MSENQKFNISLDKINIKSADKDYIKNEYKNFLWVFDIILKQ